MTRKNDLSGDGEALPEPHHNSDVEARLRFFVQGYYDFTKVAADTYVQKCQLVLEAEENLPRREFIGSSTRFAWLEILPPIGRSKKLQKQEIGY